MSGATMKSRTFGVVVALGVLIGSLVAFAPAAGATTVGGPLPCQVKNLTTNAIFGSSNGQALTDALAVANDGVTLTVRGLCVGTFTATQRGLTLKGIAGNGVPTLDGGGNGPVLTIANGADAKVRSLKITGGVANDDPQCGVGCTTGGGIRNYGFLLLNGNTNVTGNTAMFGAGVFNWGLLGMGGNAVIQQNTASILGGGVFSCGLVLRATPGVNVLNNTPNDIDTSC